MFAASKSGSVAEATDPQFNYVTMLLHGDGTNGAQNNTFLDSSTNNFTITRNGNTTQGTFTPYGANWSNYFDGTGDYLTVPDNAVLDMGSSDFTIEGWVFLSSTGSSQTFVAKGTGAGNQASYHIVFNGTNWLYYLSGNGSTWSIASGITMGAGTANTWQHLALVRSGSTFTPYVNGTAGTTTSSATALFDSTNVFSIGADDAFNQRITGYISNCRVVKGTAVYTSAFTPSTTPLTAITNTQLLTCQSNRFIDNSSNAFTVTKAGDVSVQRFSPFSPTTAYSTSVIGGSAYFDGTGDYLQTPSSSAFNFSATDCTLEFWYYGAGSGGLVFEFGSSAPDTAAMQCEFSSGTLTFKPIGASSSFFAIQPNAWNYIAAVKTGTTYYLYINGTRNTSSTGTAASTGQIINIGARNGGSVAPITGYLSDFRVSNTARYTGTTMTVPTTPSTVIANTQLMLNYTNAGILDNAEMNDLETVGNAQISTSVKKYGTGSLAFDGTGDWLQAVSTPQADFGSGNFTLECWAYLNNFSTDYRLIAKVVNISSYGSWQVLVDTSGYPRFYASSAASSWDVANGTGGGIAISTSTWAHIAVTRSGSTITMWVNGVSAGTSTSSASLYYSASVPVTVGGMPDGTRSLNGNLDEVRITKGLARYTSTFTPPIAAFPNN